jgi:two-component system LytT family response regulator
MNNHSISAIIIDDDPEAIYLLEMYLRQFPEVKLIGKSTNPKEGLSMIIKDFPDVVFLDIDMPDMTGLQVAESFKDNNYHSEVIFTTAYQHYAYQALTIQPLDFLTKPFCLTDLQRVIDKYWAKEEKKKLEQKVDQFIQSQNNSSQVLLPTTHALLFVDIKDIVIIKAKINSTEVFLQDGSVEIVTRRISTLVSSLNSTLMFQINRGIYINLNYLVRIDKKKSTCLIRYNNSMHEENITRSNLNNFKKLNIFPTF